MHVMSLSGRTVGQLFIFLYNILLFCRALPDFICFLCSRLITRKQMATQATVSIIDYQGHNNHYFRDLDAYPEGNHGFFGNFPQGARQFRLNTYVRRLCLGKDPGDYDIWKLRFNYLLDLRKRTVKIENREMHEGCELTFEEAIRRYCKPDYSEQAAPKAFPSVIDVENMVFSILIPMYELFVNTLRMKTQIASPNNALPQISVCDNLTNLRYRPFVFRGLSLYGERRLLFEDAAVNAQAVEWTQTLFDRLRSKAVFVRYTLALSNDSIVFPCTGYQMKYTQTAPDKLIRQETAQMVESFCTLPENMKALLF